MSPSMIKNMNTFLRGQSKPCRREKGCHTSRSHANKRDSNSYLKGQFKTGVDANQFYNSVDDPAV